MLQHPDITAIERDGWPTWYPKPNDNEDDELDGEDPLEEDRI